MLRATEQQPAVYSRSIGETTALQVRPDIYMLTVNGTNLAVETGPQGTVVVDTGPPGTGDAVLQAIKQLTSQTIRFVIDTNADAEWVGNNATISQAGLQYYQGFNFLGNGNAKPLPATILAQENVALDMVKAGMVSAGNTGAVPTETYSYRDQDGIYLNNQGILVLWQPSAHSNGDSVVLFRRSDVVVTGAIFDDTHFPVIDLAQGGSIQGELDALNRLLDVVVPVSPLVWEAGGTLVIPGHGRLCDRVDVVQYRDMLTIIRDRIQDLIKRGKTLRQVQAAMPTAGYTARYGSNQGAWTTDMFVEAVYKSLMATGSKATAR